MNLPTSSREESILALAENNAEIFGIVHQAITTNGINVQAYADVFQYLYSDMKSAPERLVYLPGSKVWKQGSRQLTDAAVLQELFRTCQIIREYVLLSWETCVFSSWLPARELQRAEKAMDAMESMDTLKDIMGAASELMKASARTPEPTTETPADKTSGILWDAPIEDDELQFAVGEGEE